MKRIGVTFGCLLFAGVLFWLFPLFHIISTNDSVSLQHESELSAAEFASTFWKDQLTPSLANFPDAGAVLAALIANPQSAQAKFGRKVGVSRASLYVMRGSGTVVSVDKKGVGISLGSDSKLTDVMLQTGLLFGNTIRDATGLLDASKFSDSRQFNEVSTELNHIAEVEIVSTLKQKVAVGRHITFAGCAEISDQMEVSRPLTLIPLQVSID